MAPAGAGAPASALDLDFAFVLPREAATAEGLLDRCSFVRASADSLADVPDASADVLTTRSVLIYVKDKAAALREFYRGT